MIQLIVYRIGLIAWVAGLAGCGSGNPEATPMMLAARSGDSSEVQRLLAEGNKVNELSRYGWTALMFAAWKGNQDAAKKLLDAGADPNVRSKFIHFGFMSTGGNYPDSTALEEAIRGGHPAMIDLLLERGAKIDSNTIYLAGKHGDPSLLPKLQRRGVSFRDAEVRGKVMLGACDHGNLGVVRWLLRNGAGPNENYDGQTALESAVMSDCPDVVNYLLRSGANPNLRYGSPNNETTALCDAVRKHTDSVRFEKNLAIVSSLLSHGADPSFRSGSAKRTVLQIAEDSRDHTRQLLADPKTREVIRKQSAKRLIYHEKLLQSLSR